MKERIRRHGPLIVSLILVVFCACILIMYVSPMEDLSLDLSLMVEAEGFLPEEFGEPDTKGWTVYTQEGDTKTELVPNGFGGYSGLELGQTFYFSRVMEEELDSPTLQIGTAERTFVVFLDGEVIYSDFPEQDSRIGYLRLPMNEWMREEPIIISLPADYQGKTLTVAQSFPEWSETGSVTAWPASVRLYCGYAYESGLISETTQATLISSAAFLLILVLLAGFVLSRDWSILCLALVAFHWMTVQMIGTSFYYRYFVSNHNALDAALPLVSTLALLCFLTLRGGKNRGFLWIPVVVLGISVVGNILSSALVSRFHSIASLFDTLTNNLPYWFAFACLVVVMVMGTLRWRKENWFYRVFIPLAFAGIALSWAVQVFFVNRGFVWTLIVSAITNGQIHYIYANTLTGITAAALATAVAEVIRNEMNRRAEKHLMEQRQELTMVSYENLRRQHEEVMMLRHDMFRHFRTLHDMGGDERRTAYLSELIGQNQNIRPVVESGNEMLDIILNGKLSAAVDAGIRVEVPRVAAPAQLRLSDPDLCTLVMNIVDNAISAATKSKAPSVNLNIYEKAGYLVFLCENSFDPQTAERSAKKETVPKHGLGLKIIRNIVDKYEGMIREEAADGLFTVEIVIPLD